MIAIERATDARFLNMVANHPAVRCDVADMSEGELDLSPRISDALVLQGEYGCFVLFPYGCGLYETHTLVLPEGRGEWTRQFCAEGFRYMFCGTDATEILTRVPCGHIAAKALTKLVGFERLYETPEETLFRGSKVSCSIWSLSLPIWASRATYMREAGEKFHEFLNSSELTGEPHAPDPDHDLIVGITIEMFKRGQPLKAVAWYNKWALSARHECVRLISTEPPRISFDAGVLSLAPDGQITLEARH